MANIVKIVGLKDYDFVSNEGTRLQGSKFYMLLNAGNPRVQGIEVLSLSASSTLMSTWLTSDAVKPKLGDVVELVYNRYGNLDHFRPLMLDEDAASRLFDC